ncbi:hypothetical protein L1I30_10660 [Gillisia sp. M10.2A]|uniref:UDP-glycosyltransferase n=1 Tax=Gillisia lutea TaxID=2909668 RepID=A0ABS9EIX5_9FLAO|nr:hypothetical protein [Gillisia lutea]MCF4102129.1 hypothetical protein [Gillisia lutea]
MKKKRYILGLVITDGVGLRNFILSDFLTEAEQNFDGIRIFSGLPSSAYTIDDFKKVKILELPVFKESFHTWFWRKFKEIAHLQNHKDNFGIADNLKANHSKVRSNRGYATRFIYKFTQFFHSEGIIQFLDRKHINSLKNDPVTNFCLEQLKKESPDLLFFTHQRPPYVVPLVAAANKLGIKTGSFIFSWDNLASKGRMAANFQFFLVWSELMKEELLHFYPSVQPENIKVVGTPQFEPYVLERYQSERNDFYEKFGLNPEFKTLCFSCGDVSTSKNDNLYIEYLANAIEKNDFGEKLNFLVRTSPAEEPSRFSYLKDKYSFIKWNYPKWVLARENHPEPWSQRIPSVEDIKDLRMILEFSDVGINMCSTMSLDFMTFDKPVINPVFGNMENGLYNDQRFLNYAHYKRVIESDAVVIATNENTLILAVKESLLSPENRSTERENLLKVQISCELEGTGKRMANILLNEAK